jgi:lipopolysaccharide/colanic/teichoic acid biosynthesis glycosyltransferase
MRLHVLATAALPSPASRDLRKLRFREFDFAWAFLSPFLTLLLINPYFLATADATRELVLYCAISFISSVLALVVFRVPDGVARYFSVADALGVAKAAIFSNLFTFATLFFINRLDGVPRSTLVVHALVFASGLVAAKMFTRVSAPAPLAHANRPKEYILILGANNLASSYVKLLQCFHGSAHDVVAVLDSRKNLVGRTIEGIPIVGFPEHIGAILSEYAIHGIEIKRVLVAGEPSLLTPVQMDAVTKACEQRQITLGLMAQLLGLAAAPAVPKARYSDFQANNEIAIPSYFKWKRLVDFVGAGIILVTLLPLLVCTSFLISIDLGAPILFWQQRLGRGGSPFLLFKFRTLRPPFNWRGQPIDPEQRSSHIGRVLRETAIDEIPQLLNVMIGDMSLIGPRPLLPEDQPSNPSTRLTVRPGITGWAQIHGGKLLTPAEKAAFDDWYVKNASFWVDLTIAWKTVQLLLFKTRADESAADLSEIKKRGAKISVDPRTRA